MCMFPRMSDPGAFHATKFCKESLMKILNKTMLGTAVMLCGAVCGIAPVHAQTALSTDMDQVDLTLDLFFVGANSNLYETVYPFSAAREITGGSTKPKV